MPAQLEGSINIASVVVLSAQCCMCRIQLIASLILFHCLLGLFPILCILFYSMLECIALRCNYFSPRSQAVTWFSRLTVIFRRLILSFPSSTWCFFEGVRATRISFSSEVRGIGFHKSHFISPLCFKSDPRGRSRSWHSLMCGFSGGGCISLHFDYSL